MKLSEAIRLGAMLKPQAFYNERGQQRKSGWRGWLLGQTEPTTCAFAAALDAQPCGTKRVIASGGQALRGMATTDGVETEALDVPTEWAVIYTWMPCPVCRDGDASVFQLISHLNDFHRWTREQIADWVETIEAQQEQPLPDPPVAQTVEQE